MGQLGPALAVVLLLSGQRAGQEGTITGTLRLNGAATSMTHVYASTAPGFFDKTAEDVHVLFSNVPLPDDDRRDVFAMIKRARAGDARIVEVVIDAKGQPISGSLFAREFDGMVSASGMHVFTKDRFDRTTIAGRLVVAPEHEFSGIRWSYDVTFSSPIPRPPTRADIAVQAASPPARAVEAHLAAIGRGQLARLLETMTTVAAGDFTGAGGAAAFAQLRADIPPDAKVVELIPQIDSTVIVKVEGHEGRAVIGYTFRVVMDAGVWKVTK